MYAHSVHLVL